MAKARPVTGLCAIVLAIVFNVPFSILAATYDYPDVLRRPPGEALDMFAAGGAQLILTWHAFALSALALVPMAFALALTLQRINERPALAIGAAITGALAGLAQAIGLWRWVFVISRSRPSARQRRRRKPNAPRNAPSTSSTNMAASPSASISASG